MQKEEKTCQVDPFFPNEASIDNLEEGAFFDLRTVYTTV